MKTYTGLRTRRCASVTVELESGHIRALAPRFDLRNHSPGGFEWGYGGSGPAQLALALLADALENDERAERLYQRYKFAVVAGWPSNMATGDGHWSTTDEEIRAWADAQEEADSEIRSHSTG